jgi:enoyl-CoA hydratase/carnithine racemase
VQKLQTIVVSKRPLEIEGAFMGVITLNRPKELNPLDWSTVKQLHHALKSLSEDDSVRVIGITGEGKAFSAGGDLKAYITLQSDEIGFWNFLEEIHNTFNFVEQIPKPVIALVNGLTAAGGLELMLACDIAYASESAKIGDGHLNFGQMGGGGVLSRLPRTILPGLARELLFTGKFLTSEEALQWGLVNRIVKDDGLLEAALEFANQVAKKSPLGVAKMKQVTNHGLKMRLDDAILLEMQTTHHYCLTSFDATEGLQAFSEKRQPKYEGR